MDKQSEDQPLVTNAGNEEQVKAAKKKEKLKREAELNDIVSVCSTPAGQRFMWRILSECKTFGSIYEQSAKIHYNAGKQDLGHFIMSEIIEADEQLLFEMMKQNYKGDKK